MNRKSALSTLAILAAAPLLIVGGASASDSSEFITQPGKTMVRLNSPFIEVLVDYKFANSSIGDGWLILNVAVTSSESESIEVSSNRVAVRTPDGRKIPLPAYSDFIEAYPEVQSAARRAALASDPVDFTHAGRMTCDLGFQPLPGTTSARESTWVNKRKICQALLFFPVEGGIQPGKWHFIIEFEEFDAQVPFVLGDSQ